jgi:chromosome segregation ATPase
LIIDWYVVVIVGRFDGTGGGGGGGGADPAEVRRLTRKVKELEDKLKQANGSGGGGGASAAELKQSQAAEKALQKKLKDLEGQAKRDQKSLEVRAVKAEGALSKIQGTHESLKSERDALRVDNEKLVRLTADVETLRVKAAQVESLSSLVESKEIELATLAEQFKKESNLRKKYKNELEDLKGAIRVYARCRPMARYELEKGCKQVVDIKDDTSLRVATRRGDKDYEFDAVFSPSSTQEEVFEDTKRLVESCLDGFNVCVFAYGQTGSGKVPPCPCWCGCCQCLGHFVLGIVPIIATIIDWCD